MLKIGIIGPESTGKSTLSHYLSNRYAGLLVPEYARVYLEERARECGHAYAYTRDDVLKIAEYQVQQLSDLCTGLSEGIPKGYRRNDIHYQPASNRHFLFLQTGRARRAMPTI